MTRRNELRAYALGVRRARVMMMRELNALAARLDSEMNQMRSDMRDMRADLNKLQIMQAIADVEREFGASLH
jgi:hypothetical protein